MAVINIVRNLLAKHKAHLFVGNAIEDFGRLDPYGERPAEVFVEGAEEGDFVLAAMPHKPRGLLLEPEVAAPGKVLVTMLNDTGEAMAVGTATVRVLVVKI